VSLAVSAAHHNARIPTSIASFKAFLSLLKGCDGRRRRQKGYNGYDQKFLHRLNTYLRPNPRLRSLILAKALMYPTPNLSARGCSTLT